MCAFCSPGTPLAQPGKHYVGLFPYTEYIEVAVKDPVYAGLVFGLPRGAGAIVGIRAKRNEWVRMYEQALIARIARQKDNGRPTGGGRRRSAALQDGLPPHRDGHRAISDWNYIDYVEVLGSETIKTVRSSTTAGCSTSSPSR